MKIILNADDFGYSKDVNLAIENAIIKGRISSSTIIANSPFFDEAITISKKYNNISFGVHLNLIEFAPLSDDTIFKKYNLIDENGNFKYASIFAVSHFPEELKNAIKNEWDLQIKKVIDTGLCISHIDSHQHTHSIYELEDILLELLKKYNLNRVRKNTYLSLPVILRIRHFSSPIYSNGLSINKKRTSILKKVLNHFLILPIKNKVWIYKIKKYADVCDGLFSYQIFLQEYKSNSHLYNKKTIEIECHPGLPSNSDETKLLMNDSLRKLCPDYALITYRDL